MAGSGRGRSGRYGRRGALVAAAAVAALTAAACTVPAPDRTSGGAATTAPPAALSGTLVQNRNDEAAGVMRVRLVSEDPVTVKGLEVRWPGFASTAGPVTPDYPLAAGVPADLALPLVPAACGDPPLPSPPPPDGPPVAVVTTRDPSGATATADVLLSGSEDTTGRLVARSCRAQALAYAVDVRLADAYEEREVEGIPVLRTDLVVTRRNADGPVRVTGLDGSVLIDWAPADGATLPETLDAGTAELVLPVDLRTAGRCDGHSLGESKKTYELDVLVDVDGAVAPATVVVPPEVQPRMWRVITGGCAAMGR
ncbi:MAG: hypothetical protein R2737_14705 [Candidatus Nanopelagicales bacterium]